MSCTSLEIVRSTVKSGNLFLVLEVVYDLLGSRMASQDPRYPDVEVSMTKEEALFAEWEHRDSQQGSSSEGSLISLVSSVRGLSHIGARSSS